jgi:indole-3-glycerol phosphate synthase
VATYLDPILAAHRKAAAEDRRDVAALAERARTTDVARGFGEALRRARADGELAVIAEIKRRTPSKGDLAALLDPASIAGEYAAGGATCLSVLTDHDFFAGSPGDLVAARDAVDVPVLRKDFTLTLADVYDTRIMGADAVLLIVSALPDDVELASLHGAATGVGLDVMVEVHDEAELARALTVGASIVGVNQRDLRTFEVDHVRAERMAAAIPAGVVAVAESGIRGPDDAARLAAVGYHAVLVGESLVRAPDRVAAVAALRTGIGARQ